MPHSNRKRSYSENSSDGEYKTNGQRVSFVEKKGKVGNVDLQLPFQKPTDQERYDYLIQTITYPNFEFIPQNGKMHKLHMSDNFKIGQKQRTVYIFSPTSMYRYDAFILFQRHEISWESLDSEKQSILVEYCDESPLVPNMVCQVEKYTRRKSMELCNVLQQKPFVKTSVEVWRLPGELVTRVMKTPGKELKVHCLTQSFVQSQPVNSLTQGTSGKYASSSPISKDGIFQFSRDVVPLKPNGELADVKVRFTSTKTDDITKQYGGGQKEMLLDSIILMKHSGYFKRFFDDYPTKNPDTSGANGKPLQPRVDLHKVNSEEFQHLVQYMYGSSEFDLMQLDLAKCISLFRAVQQLDIVELKRPLAMRIAFLSKSARKEVFDVLTLSHDNNLPTVFNIALETYQKQRSTLIRSAEYDAFSTSRPELVQILISGIINNEDICDPRKL